MVDPFAHDPDPTTSSGAERAKADLDARFSQLRQDAERTAEAAKDAAAHRAAAGSDRIPGGAGDPGWSRSASFKTQASRAAQEARGAAASIADQARHRLSEVVEQQKSAGASRIAGVARAAESAAKDLDGSNPELARLVRSAAESVDRIADDVREREIGDVVDTIASFGRRQPVAFFGAAVVTGFLLARFFKSDAPVVNSGGSPV